MTLSPVQSGLISTPPLKNLPAPLGPVKLTKPQDSQGLLCRTESCAASIGQNGNPSDVAVSDNISGAQNFTTRGITVKPSLHFKPVLGEGISEVLLVKKIANSQFKAETPSVNKSTTESESNTKRKSLVTPHDDEQTHDAKTSTKRPRTSKEQGSDELTELSNVQKSQSNSVNIKDSLKRPTAIDSSTASTQQRSRYDSSNLKTGSTSQSSSNHTRDSRSSFDQRAPANNRTQYIARRVQPHDANQYQPPSMMEATLRKIYVEMIKSGKKTIEGRINSGMFRNLRVGQLARFFYTGRESGEVTCKITKLNTYNSFEEMLTEEGHKPCLPDASSLQEAINTYDRIPTFTERAKRSGVVAIHLEKISQK